MDFLKRAQAYAESINDQDWFAHYYTIYREEHLMNVHDSVYATLACLYGEELANTLE